MNGELVARIRLAMSSDKFSRCPVNFSLKADFEDLLKSHPDADLEKECAPFLLEATRSDKEFPEKLDSIGNIYAVLVPFANLPALVDDPEFLKFEYSTSRFVTDE